MYLRAQTKEQELECFKTVNGICRGKQPYYKIRDVHRKKQITWNNYGSMFSDYLKLVNNRRGP